MVLLRCVEQCQSLFRTRMRKIEWRPPTNSWLEKNGRKMWKLSLGKSGLSDEQVLMALRPRPEEKCNSTCPNRAEWPRPFCSPSVVGRPFFSFSLFSIEPSAPLLYLGKAVDNLRRSSTKLLPNKYFLFF